MCVVNLKALHLTKLIRTFHKVVVVVATDSGYLHFKSRAGMYF